MSGYNKLEFRFNSKEDAIKFRDGAIQANVFRCSNMSLRKSLPEFRGQINKQYSLFLTPFTLADEIALKKFKQKYNIKLFAEKEEG